MNSFIGWIGGKKLLRKEIVKKFLKKFNRYIEAFGGAERTIIYVEFEGTVL